MFIYALLWRYSGVVVAIGSIRLPPVGAVPTAPKHINNSNIEYYLLGYSTSLNSQTLNNILFWGMTISLNSNKNKSFKPKTIFYFDCLTSLNLKQKQIIQTLNNILFGVLNTFYYSNLKQYSILGFNKFERNKNKSFKP